MAFELDSLEGIRLFLQANGRVFHHERVRIGRLQLRDGRAAMEFLGPSHRSGELVVANFSRLDALSTASFMLECADMIVDDLLGEVESRRLNPEHVEAFRGNAAYLRDELIGDSFFVFVTDVAQEMITIARSMERPFHRDFARHHHPARESPRHHHPASRSSGRVPERRTSSAAGARSGRHRPLPRPSRRRHLLPAARHCARASSRRRGARGARAQG